MRSSFPAAIVACAIANSSVSQDPTTVAVEKHATYTVASDGWPYAFLPDGDGFYLMVGGMTRAPKAFRYDSTGHKGSPRTGIDLTRRSTDLAAWRMEDGKIFNVVFGPPEDAAGEGEIIWGFVDPLKPDPAEPHPIGRLANADQSAPLSWASSAVLVGGHHAFWLVPHMKKKECTSLAVAVVNWRTGKARTQEVLLPRPLSGITFQHLSANDAGDALLAITGTDPATKKDGWTEWRSWLVGLKADGGVAFMQVAVPGHVPGCVACVLENSGMARCAGLAVSDDRSTPAIVHARFLAGSDTPIDWWIHPLDEERTRQLADRSRDPKEMESSKPEKPDPQARSKALAAVLARSRPILVEMLPGDSLLFASEVQVRNDYLGDPAEAAPTGNVRDQLLYAILPAAGDPRAGVVRKFLVEEGVPGFGDPTRTLVRYDRGRLLFFFNDWEKHEFARGAAVPDKFARINVATLEGAGAFDPVVHVEGSSGPIERMPLQRSTSLDYMLNGCSLRAADGSMIIALTKGRGIQFLKVTSLP